MKHLRKRLTYANVMSPLAVFLILGGATAFAAKKVGSNELKAGAVKTGKLAKEAVKAAKLAKNAVTTPKIANDAVTGAKVDEATLGIVPDAAKLAGKSPAAFESKAFHVYDDGNSPLSESGKSLVSSLALPAGTYVVFARGVINNNGTEATGSAGKNSVNCDLTAGTTTVEARNFLLGAAGDPAESEDFSFNLVHTFAAPGTAEFTCSTDEFKGNVLTPEMTAISVQP